jgi:hypothetical protein
LHVERAFVHLLVQVVILQDFNVLLDCGEHE